MPNCPRCHQSVSSQVVTCPHCGTTLKAYGHPGITLHQAVGKTPLCESCIYHTDDTCTFAQRPYALECTLYNDINQPQVNAEQIYAPRRSLAEKIRLWCQRNPVWLGLMLLLTISFLIALVAEP
ncbi:MAG: hypothetical protein WA919_22940 [Coleofasciculaceae cyanobacterium]